MSAGGVVQFLSGLDIGGKERVALELARRGRAAGRDDRLIVFDSAFRDATRDLDPGDVPVELIPRGPGLDHGFARAVARRLRELQPVAIHGHNDTGVFYAGFARALSVAAMGRRAPRCVATFHARPIHATRGARWSTRAACLAATHVTAVSDDLAGWLRREGWCGACEVVGNGIDLTRFHPEVPAGGWRARLGVPDGGRLVVHLGRLDPIKRHVDLIEAWGRVEAAGAQQHLLCAGDGDERPRLDRAAAELSTFHHEPGIQDVPGLLVEADLLVLCSAFEATPMVVLEALACGVPVLATAVGGVPALAAGDTSGLAIELVPAQDPERLAAALRELAAETPARAEERRAAALRLGRRFDWAEAAGRYEQLYRGA